MRKLTTVIGLVLILALGLAAIEGRSQPARAADGDNLVLVWNEETLESIRKLPPAPTVAARALAIAHGLTRKRTEVQLLPRPPHVG